MLCRIYHLEWVAWIDTWQRDKENVVYITKTYLSTENRFRFQLKLNWMQLKFILTPTHIHLHRTVKYRTVIYFEINNSHETTNYFMRWIRTNALLLLFMANRKITWTKARTHDPRVREDVQVVEYFCNEFAC